MNGIQEVRGSIPLSSTINIRLCADFFMPCFMFIRTPTRLSPQTPSTIKAYGSKNKAPSDRVFIKTAHKTFLPFRKRFYPLIKASTILIHSSFEISSKLIFLYAYVDVLPGRLPNLRSACSFKSSACNSLTRFAL